MMSQGLFLLFSLILNVAQASEASHHAEESSVHDEKQVDQENKQVPVATLVDLPAKCLAKKVLPCAVQITSVGEFEWLGTKLQVAEKTSLLLTKEGLEVLAGELWSDNFSRFVVQHGALRAQVSGDVFIEKSDSLIRFYSLNGNVRISGAGLGKQTVPAGFQNWYQGIGQGGEWQQGVVEPLRFDAFLPAWRRVLTGLPANFKEKIAVYRDHQKRAVFESAELYHGILQKRRIAAETEEKRKWLERRKQMEEKNRFKKMMVDRLFGSGG